MLIPSISSDYELYSDKYVEFQIETYIFCLTYNGGILNIMKQISGCDIILCQSKLVPIQYYCLLCSSLS